ncbi:MAG: hypothetical protein HY074_04555 [Deltaproteobacteria bacterium]|nr:hypothetical protein [Deltaproteobacteria bacterium]
MHYLAKAGGFDATDWLPFQQKFLRTPATSTAAAEEVRLAPEPPAQPDGTPLPLADPARLATSTTPEPPSTSILKKWWFWALVGGVGAGAFALTRLGQHDSNSMNVEIR